MNWFGYCTSGLQCRFRQDRRWPVSPLLAGAAATGPRMRRAGRPVRWPYRPTRRPRSEIYYIRPISRARLCASSAPTEKESLGWRSLRCGCTTLTVQVTRSWLYCWESSRRRTHTPGHGAQPATSLQGDAGTTHPRPVAENLQLDWNADAWAADPDRQIIVWTTEPDSASQYALCQLASPAADLPTPQPGTGAPVAPTAATERTRRWEPRTSEGGSHE